MDDMSRKINEFLSDPESMEKIRGLMGMLGVSPGGNAGSNPGGNTGGPAAASTGGPAAPPPGAGSPPPGAAGSPEMPLDPAMIRNMKRAFDLMRTDDPRITLLLALKPNLSEDRRRRVDEAIQLMRLIHLIPLLREGIFPPANPGGGPA